MSHLTPQERAELSLVVARAMGQAAYIHKEACYLSEVQIWGMGGGDAPWDPTIPGADFSKALLWLYSKTGYVELTRWENPHNRPNGIICECTYSEGDDGHLMSPHDVPTTVCFAIKELAGVKQSEKGEVR